MKAKYIFSHETGAITKDTVFYTVYIGDSDYGRRLLKRCQALQFLTDYFFAKYNESTADFLQKVADSLFPGVTLSLLRLRHERLTERQFSRMLSDGVFNRHNETTATCSMLCQLDTRFYSNHHNQWNRK